MTVFSFDDYKSYVREFITNQPKNGRGQARQIAQYLSIHPVIVSQVLSGARDFTPEQGLELSDYLGLMELERDYFLALINIARAGTHRLKDRYLEQAKTLRRRALDLSHRLEKDIELNQEMKAQFYSRWYFSGIRLAASLPEINSPLELSERLKIPLGLASSTLEFLLSTGLCIQTDKGLDIGPKRTHLESQSPLVQNHHRNWRLKALTEMETSDPSALFYTGPMALSEEAFDLVREEIVQLLSRIRSLAETSASETLSCCNIDFFSYGKE